MKVLIPFILILFFYSCNNQISDTKDLNIKIGITVSDYKNISIKNTRKGMKNLIDTFKNNGMNIDYTFLGALNSSYIQLRQIENFIKQKYDIIVIDSVSYLESKYYINILKKANIPVIFFHNELPTLDLKLWENTFYIYFDKIEFTKKQAKIVKYYWENNIITDRNKNGRLDYVLVKGNRDDEETKIRSINLDNDLLNNNLRVLKYFDIYGNWSRNIAKEEFYKKYNFFKDDVDVIISNNDMMLLGIIDFFNENRIRKLPLIGIGGHDKAITKLVSEGDILATIVNSYVKKGEEIIKLAFNILNNKLDKSNFYDRYIKLDYDTIFYNYE